MRTSNQAWPPAHPVDAYLAEATTGLMQYTDVLTLVGARCQPLIRCNFYTKGFIKSFAHPSTF